MEYSDEYNSGREETTQEISVPFIRVTDENKESALNTQSTFRTQFRKGSFDRRTGRKLSSSAYDMNIQRELDVSQNRHEAPRRYSDPEARMKVADGGGRHMEEDYNTHTKPRDVPLLPDLNDYIAPQSPSADIPGMRTSVSPPPLTGERLTVVGDTLVNRRKPSTDISFNIQHRKSIHEMTPRMQAQVARFEAMSDTSQATLAANHNEHRRPSLRGDVTSQKRHKSASGRELLSLSDRSYSRESMDETDHERPPSRRDMVGMDNQRLYSVENQSHRRLSSDGEEIRIYERRGSREMKVQGRRKSLKNKIYEIERRKSITEDIDALERRLSNQGSESDNLSQHSGRSSPDATPVDTIPTIKVRRYSDMVGENDMQNDSEMDNQFLKSISPYLTYRKSVSELEPYLNFQDEISSITPEIQAQVYMNEESINKKYRRNSQLYERSDKTEDPYNENKNQDGPYNEQENQDDSECIAENLQTQYSDDSCNDSDHSSKTKEVEPPDTGSPADSNTLHPGVSNRLRRKSTGNEMLDSFLRRLSKEPIPDQELPRPDESTDGENMDTEEQPCVAEEHPADTNSFHPNGRRPSAVLEERWRTSSFQDKQPLAGLYDWLDARLEESSTAGVENNLPRDSITGVYNNEDSMDQINRPSSQLHKKADRTEGSYNEQDALCYDAGHSPETVDTPDFHESVTNNREPPADSNSLHPGVSNQLRRKSTGNDMLDSFLRRLSKEPIPDQTLPQLNGSTDGENMGTKLQSHVAERLHSDTNSSHSTTRRSSDAVDEKWDTSSFQDRQPLAVFYEWLDARSQAHSAPGVVTSSPRDSATEPEVGSDAVNNVVSLEPRKSFSTVVYDFFTRRPSGEQGKGGDQVEASVKASTVTSKPGDETKHVRSHNVQQEAGRETKKGSTPSEIPNIKYPAPHAEQNTENLVYQEKKLPNVKASSSGRSAAGEVLLSIEPAVSSKHRLSIGKEMFDKLVRRFSALEQVPVPDQLPTRTSRRKNNSPVPSDGFAQHQDKQTLTRDSTESTKSHQSHTEMTSSSEDELITSDGSESDLEYSWTINEPDDDEHSQPELSNEGDTWNTANNKQRRNSEKLGDKTRHAELRKNESQELGVSQDITGEYQFELSTKELIQFLLPDKLGGIYRYLFGVDSISVPQERQQTLSPSHRLPGFTESQHYTSLEEQVVQAMSRLDGVRGWTTMERVAIEKKKKPIDSITAVTFCGCGFLGVYLVGAATCLQEKHPQLLKGRLGGSSVGSIVATCIVCDIPLQVVRDALLRTAKMSRNYLLGPFSPSFPLEEPLLRSLLELLPEDAHIRATGRLFLSLTRASTLTNEVVSEYKSRDELLRAVLCCCFLPVISGFSVPTFQDRRYIDGGMSNNIPLKGPNTLTINAFAGEFDICPTDDKTYYGPTTALNQTLYMSNENLQKFYRALVPPVPEDLDEYFTYGYNDAMKYIS